MKNLILAIGVCFFFCRTAAAEDRPPPQELLKEYPGNVQLPDELYEAYAALLAAIETGDPDTIKKHCLPQSVSISTIPRPAASREYGEDINLPFFKDGFHRYILNLRKDAEDKYLIRTGSTALWFVRAGDEGWKLYRYLDKPIM